VFEYSLHLHECSQGVEQLLVKLGTLLLVALVDVHRDERVRDLELVLALLNPNQLGLVLCFDLDTQIRS